MSMLNTLIDVGGSYHAHDRLEDRELEALAAKADEQLSTMNGDTGRIEITVRQFALLLHGWANQAKVQQ